MGRFVRSTRPYWLKSKFGGKCSKCGFGIKKGEDILRLSGNKDSVLCRRRMREEGSRSARVR